MASHRRNTHRVLRCGTLTLLPAVSAVAAVGAVTHLATSSPHGTAPVPPAVITPVGPTGSDVRMVGQVVAVAPDSITTRGPDGNIMTFVITPATSKVSTGGFEVDQTVTVLGTMNGNTPVASAVAAQSMAGLSGPPMDSDT